MSEKILEIEATTEDSVEREKDVAPDSSTVDVDGKLENATEKQ